MGEAVGGPGGTITLILGGARSGKSRFSEELARSSGRPVIYVATATAGDDEMAERIAAHQRARYSQAPDWVTVEEPLALASAVERAARPAWVVLVDCLSLWTSNELLAPADEPGDWDDARWLASQIARVEERALAEIGRLLDVAVRKPVDLILVSNEVGMGLVPPYPLGRAYRDLLGRINQLVASRATHVYLMVAGLPIDLRRLMAEAPPSGRGLG